MRYFFLIFCAGVGRGVYLVFRDQGACATLLSVRVFYVTCPAVMTSLASFPETPAGRQITSIVQRDGVCVANSVPAASAGRPTYLCKADGSWYFLSGECHCLPGYEPHDNHSRCAGNLYLWQPYYCKKITRSPVIARNSRPYRLRSKPSVRLPVAERKRFVGGDTVSCTLW